MSIRELRQTEVARRYLLQSFYLARAVAPTAPHLAATLEWSHEIAAAGAPLPPLGLVCDVGHIALGEDRDRIADPHQTPGLDAAMLRRYEDYVLGKLYADLSFERGADALMQYQGRDRTVGLSFLISQFRERAGLPSVMLSPAVLKSMQENETPEALLSEAWASIESEGLLPELSDDYRDLAFAARNLGEVLGSEDVLELERGTAVEGFSQRIALRQIWQGADRFEHGLPRRKVRSSAPPRQVATRMMEEDTYPVGGFTSISNRGTVESLLHSQLAYMETDDRPDLFDVKFLRDELLYYARDENQFLRQRRTFVFALAVDLVEARVKDAEAPYQRIVLLLAMLQAAVRKLTDWLSTDALRFEFVLLRGKTPSPLEDEEGLLQMMFRDEIASGIVSIESAAKGELAGRCAAHIRKSLCHCLVISSHELALETAAEMSSLTCAAPVLSTPSTEPHDCPGDTPWERWEAALLELLACWV